MPRATTNKLYRTFVKGLITEAGPLTYPENASINEDNCVIYQKGNRSRRKGVDFENGHTTSSFYVPIETINQSAITTHVWFSADNKSTKNFLVVQAGRHLYFYDMSYDPLSAGLQTFSVDLNDFAVGGQNPEDAHVHAVAGKGLMFVVSSKIDPFYILYNSTNNTITTQRIVIKIRDFKGLDDGLANDEEPGTLSAEHDYNLRNQGWIDPGNGGGGSSVTYYSPFGGIDTYTQATTAPISTYFTSLSRYPGNNKQWWIAKNATTGAFDPTLLGKFYFGNTRAPRGHYVVDAFNIDRSAVSGVASIPIESITNRPSSVAFFSGRVWYAVDSNIYFSQILDDKSKAGMCFMEADPTSEDISDLIATDGGVIPIPEMVAVNRIMPVAGGVLCFAQNGIWFVSGTQNGFSASDISVTKISPIGTDSPRSIIHVQDNGSDMVLWWSKVGIQGMKQSMGQFGPIQNKFDTSIISLNTIQTFWNTIDKDALQYVTAHYDPTTNVVQWLFRDNTTLQYPTLFNRVLNYDLTLGAFYPWTVSHVDGTNGPFLAGGFQTQVKTANRNIFTKYLCLQGNAGQFAFSFAEENNDSFADWDAAAFSSYVETGYELLEDAMRNKQAMYVYCYFKRTEENYVIDGDDYTTDHPSSCFFQVKWDWASSQVSNRWSQKTQAYRILQTPPIPADLTYDTGFPIVVTRNKVRGHGRAIQFRFENNDTGSDFDLLGWAVPYSGNTNP
jgi:hypothetical protein